MGRRPLALGARRDAGREPADLRHTAEGPDWVPKIAAGWHLCFVVAGRLLDGDPIGPIRGRAALAHGWQELHDAYADRLGGAGAAAS